MSGSDTQSQMQTAGKQRSHSLTLLRTFIGSYASLSRISPMMPSPVSAVFSWGNADFREHKMSARLCLTV